MSELEDAMLLHMAHLNFEEGDSFSYLNFMPFEVDERQYNPKYGTIKNIFSKFRKEGKIKYYSKSIPAFYELTESNLPKKSMTLTHTGGLSVISHNDTIYRMFEELPMGQESIHDIRAYFEAPNIYKTFSTHTPYKKQPYSLDLMLPEWQIDNARVHITIHRPNTISVILACSREPFPLDYNGILALFTTLGQVRGLLVGALLSIYNNEINEHQTIPHHFLWTITMWHFGRDCLERSKKDYHVTVGRANDVLQRYYIKHYGKHKKNKRDERQEYPNKPSILAIKEKVKNSDLNLDLDTTPFIDSELPNIGTN